MLRAHHVALLTLFYLIKISPFSLKSVHNTKSHGSNMAQRKLKVLDGIDALFLDCDGTIAETEKNLTLKQFNEAFITKNLDIVWDENTYGELLKEGVSQQRYAAYFKAHGYPQGVSDFEGFCQEMKEIKDQMFERVWFREQIQARPGILQLVDTALAAGIRIAVCSNSNFAPVHTICSTLFGAVRMGSIEVIGGDSPGVSKKKPSPEIYLLAASRFGLSPSTCLVIEDSEVGLRAAKAAGMRCVVTPSYYTQNEDFSLADIVVPTVEFILDDLVIS